MTGTRSASLQRFLWPGARRLERGAEAREQPGEKGRSASDREDTNVDGNFRGAWQRERVHRVDRPPREDHSDQSAGEGEHERLGDELTDDLPPARPEGGANGEFKGATGCPDEDEI